MNALVYQRCRREGEYIVVHRRSGTQLGTVAQLVDDGMWLAKSADGKAQFAFRLRQDAGVYLLHVATPNGCEPGCPCAEG